MNPTQKQTISQTKRNTSTLDTAEERDGAEEAPLMNLEATYQLDAVNVAVPTEEIFNVLISQQEPWAGTSTSGGTGSGI